MASAIFISKQIREEQGTGWGKAAEEAAVIIHRKIEKVYSTPEDKEREMRIMADGVSNLFRK